MSEKNDFFSMPFDSSEGGGGGGEPEPELFGFSLVVMELAVSSKNDTNLSKNEHSGSPPL